MDLLFGLMVGAFVSSRDSFRMKQIAKVKQKPVAKVKLKPIAKVTQGRVVKPVVTMKSVVKTTPIGSAHFATPPKVATARWKVSEVDSGGHEFVFSKSACVSPIETLRARTD